MKIFCVNIECIIEHNFRFIVTKRPAGKHAAGLLSLPGGKVIYKDGLKDNILFEAVKRVILDKVGIKLIEPINFVTSSYFISEKEHIINIVFYCKIINFYFKKNMNQIDSKYHFLTFDEILNNDDTPAWLNGYLNNIKK